jgi:hypothetical protein
VKIYSFLLRILLALLSALYLQCSSLGEIPLAGGSGAGNPGGTVSVALSIFSDTGLAKTAFVADAAVNSADSPKSVVTVKDLAGLAVTITGVQLHCTDLRLVLDQKEWTHYDLDSLEERPSYLSNDSQSLIINKRFSFNALEESPDSTIPPVIMPVARYTGVKLNFSQPPPSQTDTGWKSEILLTGSFVYNGQTQNFQVKINPSFSPFYKFAGGIFTLSADDTTHLELRFNASQWFHRVNFKQLLDQEVLVFNPTGDIIISSNSHLSGIQDLVYCIGMDFFNSGKLVVY